MFKIISRNEKRKQRHKRIYKKIINHKLLRLVVFRSNKNIEIQVIDDLKRNTLVSVNSKMLKLKNNNIDSAKILGKEAAIRCIKNNIKEIVFDRNGYYYCGRIKALAESLRENGIKF